MNNKQLIRLFDDVVTDEDGQWSQVCSYHMNKYFLLDDITFDHASIHGKCGVLGCTGIGICYIDFNIKDDTKT